ncbi:hypothetical protein KCG35_06850 [Zooshikella sp. WH53]|uniref:Transposase DDE domain-containing protein n=1 Tax=Zooshikella harenae TaxID=2827238 RepID=A0ABS5Z9P4_9GAMM|nr:hypothetical protein [Zooshikella harenae]MBU2710771.1 hypothetical protein [Zooshikella harenae]
MPSLSDPEAIAMELIGVFLAWMKILISGGILLGDKGYLGVDFKVELLQLKAVQLETPVKEKMVDQLLEKWRG